MGFDRYMHAHTHRQIYIESTSNRIGNRMQMLYEMKDILIACQNKRTFNIVGRVKEKLMPF